MKSVMYVGLILIAFSIQAQDRDRQRDQDRIDEYLLYQDGVLLQIGDRDQVQVQQRLTLRDGSSVTPDGLYVNLKGEQLRLRDGECLDMDGNRYNTPAQFRQHLGLRKQADGQLHFRFQDGEVVQVQDQDRTQLRERLMLKDGGYINADGTYQLRDQQQMRLRDGECLDPEGNLFGSAAQFRNYTKQRLQANAQEHFLFQNGKMFRVKNAEQAQLQQPLTMQNDLVINPDGSFVSRDQKRLQLRDGECIDAEGNLFGSQAQLREHAMTRLQAMDQEHFIYQNGNMYQVQHQDQIQMRQPLTLHNGLAVNADGTYQYKHRKRERLADGECLDMDGNRYKSQAEFHQQMQNHLQAMGGLHYFFQDGKLYRSQHQTQQEVKDQWKLRDGTMVNPDGSYMLKNGKREHLRNGEVLDWGGKKYENRERFREKMELRVRDRMEMKDKDMHERRSLFEGKKHMGN